jgi:hypothetical protein
VLAVQKTALSGPKLHHKQTGLGVPHVHKQHGPTAQAPTQVLYPRETVLRTNASPVVHDPCLPPRSCDFGASLYDPAFVLREVGGDAHVAEISSHSMLDQDLADLPHQGDEKFLRLHPRLLLTQDEDELVVDLVLRRAVPELLLDDLVVTGETDESEWSTDGVVIVGLELHGGRITLLLASSPMSRCECVKEMREGVSLKLASFVSTSKAFQS